MDADTRAVQEVAVKPYEEIEFEGKPARKYPDGVIRHSKRGYLLYVPTEVARARREQQDRQGAYLCRRCHSRRHDADLAAFGQTFLNGGHYGDARVLPRSTVALMTRNHTPGLKGSIAGHHLAEMSVGYSWFIQHPMKFPFLGPALGSPGSYSHAGWGGSLLWVDPVKEMVLVFLSTQHDVWIPARFPAWEADLFVNAATSAVADE